MTQISLDVACQHLRAEHVIVTPSESVYGLCAIPTHTAIQRLLAIKQRLWQKGFILVAATLAHLEAWVDWSALSSDKQATVQATWPGPITWLLPTHPSVPEPLVLGDFQQVAVRLTSHPTLRALCRLYDSPLLSTSANLSGEFPCRTLADVTAQLGTSLPILEGALGTLQTPTPIYDALSGKRIR